MKDKEFIDKGYRIHSCYADHEESVAKEKAKWLRECGYRARVQTYSTCIRGIHDYAVWYKDK